MNLLDTCLSKMGLESYKKWLDLFETLKANNLKNLPFNTFVVFSLYSFPKRRGSTSSTVNLKTVLLESTTNMATVATHVVGKTYSRIQSDQTKNILIVALAHSRQSQKQNISFLPFNPKIKEQNFKMLTRLNLRSRYSMANFWS